MARIKRAVHARKKKNAYLKAAKGYRGGRGRLWRTVKDAVERAREAITLGLAPFLPEPHIVGKIRWIMGGGVGMGPMDYLDVLLHGAPWLWLFFSLFKWIQGAKKNVP